MEYQSKDITIEGKRIYYETNPGQNTIVFLHGANLNLTVFNKIRKHFVDKGFGTISIDLRGHGKSCNLNSSNEFSIESCAKDLAAILEKECVKLPIIVGYSAGGMIAQAYASKHDTQALVLLATSYDIKTTFCRGIKRKILFKLRNFGIYVVFLANKWIGAKEKNYLDYCTEKYGKVNTKQFIYNAIKYQDNETIQNCSYITNSVSKWNTLAHMIKINAPCLVISGDNDMLMPLPTAHELGEMLPNCRETAIITNANHGIPFTHSQEVIAAMEKFFNVSIEKN